MSHREHSERELRRKLTELGATEAEKDLIDSVISTLIQDDYLSDQRYTEVYIRSKARRGYGPNYCRQALRQAGVSSDLIEAGLKNPEIDWQEISLKVCEKKSKILDSRDSDNPKNKLKLNNFLKGRGF